MNSQRGMSMKDMKEQLALEQFRAARERVGVGPERNLEWLFRFARQPLSLEGPHTAERDQLWAELLALGILAERAPESAGQDLAGKELNVWPEAMSLMRWPDGFPVGPEPLASQFLYEKWQNSVRSIQRAIAAAIRDLLAHKTVAIPITNASYIVRIDEQPPRLSFALDRIQLDTGRSGLEGAVLGRLVQILGVCANRIRECHCGMLFIAKRTDQTFHDRNCQMRELMKKRREALEQRQSKKKGGRTSTKKRKQS